jgi:hypothetical protein
VKGFCHAEKEISDALADTIASEENLLRSLNEHKSVRNLLLILHNPRLI